MVHALGGAGNTSRRTVHALSVVEKLVLGHKRRGEDKKPSFMVNKRAVVSDMSGMSTGPIQSFR